MAKPSHVPKFGTWEGEEVAYTAYFETARKGRGAVGGGGRIINPNDPEEAQELITSWEGQELQHAAAEAAASSINLNTKAKTHPGAAVGLSNSSTAANKNINGAVYALPQQQRLQVLQQKHAQQHGKELAVRASAGRDRAQQYVAPCRNQMERSKSPGFGGEEGYSSSSSSAHSHQGAAQFPQGKNSTTRVRQSPRDYGAAAASPQHPTPPRTKNNNLQAEAQQQHRRAASVPRFGAWGAASPEAGAGFTVIFDRVKEERQQAANKVPTTPVTAPMTTPTPYSPRQERLSDHTRPAKSNKMFCCFLPMVD